MSFVASTEPHQQLQQQQNDVSSSSSLCLYTVVMVTVPLCVVVLLTLTAIITLYALSARRRRRMTSKPGAAFPLPVSTECQCVGVDGHSWLARRSACRTHLPVTATDDHRKSIKHHNHNQQQQLLDSDSRYNDARHLSVVVPTSPSLNDNQPLKPASNHSESTLLLVARDAWTS